MTTDTEFGPVLAAYPIIQPPGAILVSPGMTLRDYFAGIAMETIAGTPLEDIPPEASGLTMGQWLGRQCYALADAMIAARSEILSEPDATTEPDTGDVA